MPLNRLTILSWIAERETEIDIENGDYKTALAKMEREDFKKPKIYFIS